MSLCSSGFLAARVGSLLFTVYGFVSFNYCEVPRCSGDQCHEHLGSKYLTKHTRKTLALPPSLLPRPAGAPQGAAGPVHPAHRASRPSGSSFTLFPAKAAPFCLFKLLPQLHSSQLRTPTPLGPSCRSGPHPRVLRAARAPPLPGLQGWEQIRFPAPFFLLPSVFLRLLGSVLYNKVTCMANSINVYQTWTCRSPPPVTYVLFICSSSAASGLLQASAARSLLTPL